MRPDITSSERAFRAEALRQRRERANELYLEGEIDKSRYMAKKKAMQEELAHLCPAKRSDVISAHCTLQQFKQLWDDAPNLEKKKLLKGCLSAAFVRGLRLSAVQPHLQFYPLISLGVTPGFYYGSDGIRTRDLRLDRPAC